jgi:hypothetical protein
MHAIEARGAAIAEEVLPITVELTSTIHERLRGVLVDARQGVTGRGRRVRGLSRRPSIPCPVVKILLPVMVERGSTIHERLRGYAHGFRRLTGMTGS